MRGLRGWIVIGGIAIAIAAVATLAQPHDSSPEHSSNSDAANGTSAVLLFSQAMGHPTTQIEGDFSVPARDGLLFVFTPTSPFSANDADRAATWVRNGGVLVYASEDGDAELDRALSVGRYRGTVPSSVESANPTLEGVKQVSGGDFAQPLRPGRQQVPILRSPDGFALGYMQRVGLGTLVVLADPLVLCNGYLEKLNNGRLLADLLGMVADGATIAVDEYHHGLILTNFSPQAWVLTPWGAALLWLLVAVFAGLVLRGRRFGPLMPRVVEGARTDSEWASAVGELLRRSGGRSLTLGVLASASERAVAARTGLQAQPRERFWNALHVRAPDLAAELAAAENALYGATGGDAELLSAAQRLHRIAYPVVSERRRNPNPKEAR